MSALRTLLLHRCRRCLARTVPCLAGAALSLDIHKNALDETIKGSRDWHYDDRPSCEPAVPRTEYCPAGNCASVQLKRHYGIRIDPEASPARKRFAIRVIAHLAGDVHQPLHASDHDDVGGNIKLTGNWMVKPNLHSAWDTDFVSRAFAGPDFKNKSEQQIAAALLNQVTDVNKQEWAKGPITAWLQQSYDLAVKLTYGQLPGFTCQVANFEAKPVTLTDDTAPLQWRRNLGD